MKYAVIMIPLLLLSSGPAYAEWVKVTESEGLGGSTVYVDLDTIRIHLKGNLVKMWTLYDYHTIQTLGPVPYLSFKGQEQFDCEEERIRKLAFTFFSGHMGRGEVVVSNSDETKWAPVRPESVGEGLWKLACGKQ